MIVKTTSPEQTQDLAKQLASKFRSGGVIALSGDLGAGKTTFSQGLAFGLGIKTAVISPTFILIRSYDIPQKKNGKFFHIDLYRLEEQHQVDQLGIKELFNKSENIILIEWAEKIQKQLPSNTTKINIKVISENERQIEIED